MNATLIVKILFFLECFCFIFLSFIFTIITTKTKKNKKVFLIKKNNIHKEVDIPVNSTKFQISIAYSTDNKFLYPTLVSITSLLENIKYNKTFYDIYIMITDDFENRNKNILESVEKRYPRQCKINFIEMGNMFNEQKVLPASKYYRLALHDKLPNINKIIYLDGDTMIFEDLTELFTLNMKGYYILGFLDSIISDVEKYGIKNATVLCTGVLLMDLEGLRNFNSTEKFKQFMISHNNQFDKADQNVINAVLQGHLHTLPQNMECGDLIFIHMQKSIIMFKDLGLNIMNLNLKKLLNIRLFYIILLQNLLKIKKLHLIMFGGIMQIKQDIMNLFIIIR